MNLFDIRTLIFSYIISNAICLIVIAALWFRNRNRFDGLGLWLADFAIQFTVILLVAVRGMVPDFLSIVVSNALVIAGTILMYVGLEYFVDKRTSQVHNYILLVAFIFIHTYFAFVQPNLLIRTINLAAGIIILCSQCAWLLIYRTDADMRPITRGVGYIFLAFCLFSIARIIADLIVNPGNDFFNSGLFEGLAVLINQMLFIILTFGLLLMVNRRLVLDLEHDIIERKQAEEKSRSLARFPDENPNPVLRATYEGKILYANAASELLLNDWHCQVGGYLPPYWIELIGELINTGSRKTMDVRCQDTTYSIMIAPVPGVNYVNLYGRDITERKQMEERLVQLSRAVEQSPASIVITDLKGKIQYVNARFSQVTGYSLEEAIGQNPRILKSNQTPIETYQDLWQALTTGGEWHGEFINRKKNGELYFEFAMISPIAKPDGVITHYLAVKEDITERKRSEEELRLTNQKLETQMKEIQALQASLYELAIRDSLTGLYNRRFLNESLEKELARAARDNYPVSFVMIDIDKFKAINDTFGHNLGDLALQNLAGELNRHTRKSDIACRYGGDECLIVLPNTSVESASQIAERLRESFESSKVRFEEIEITATISLGVATFPLHGLTSREILSAADQALYKAKLEGRNNVVLWR